MIMIWGLMSLDKSVQTSEQCARVCVCVCVCVCVYACELCKLLVCLLCNFGFSNNCSLSFKI